MILQFILMALFLCLSGFFSGTETAFTSLSEAQIQHIRKKWGKRGALIYHLTSQPGTLLTTVLVGNTLVNIALSVMASELTIRLFGSTVLGITTGILTLLVLVFGEVAPKQLAIVHNERWAVHTVRVITVLSVVLKPINWFIGLAGRLVTRLSGRNTSRGITREGILYLVKHAEDVGILDALKSRMVKNVFRFTEVTVNAVMTHRTKVFSLDKNLTIDEAFPRIVEEGYTRIPVFDEHPEHIVGIVLLMDILRALAGGEQSEPLKRIMVDAIYVPENKKINAMLAQFRREGLNIAIVLDEYGGVSGVVTVEDIIEEILGEIYDEHEVKEREKITPLGENTYLILADIPIYVFNDWMELELPENKDIQTLGGYLADLAGRIPSQNEVIETPVGKFVIDTISRKRIVSVRFARPESEDDYDEPGD